MCGIAAIFSYHANASRVDQEELNTDNVFFLKNKNIHIIPKLNEKSSY
jgi:hypothetical protein